MTKYAFHWPSMGIEEGEYVGVGEADKDLDDNPRLQAVLFTSGLLASLVNVAIVAGLGVLLVEALGSTALAWFGSIPSAIFVSMVAVTASDLVLMKLTLSPLRATSGILALSLILPVVYAYAIVERRFEEVDDRQELALLAGNEGAARVIAARIYNRSKSGPKTVTPS